MNKMRNNLIKAVIQKKENISYINLDKDNKYLGWTHDFNLVLPSGERMRFDLKEGNDLFLLFILASSWSKTGPWENAAYFVTYLKKENKADIDFWKDDNNITLEITERKTNANNVVIECKGIVPRKKVSFRKDYYTSIKVLAEHWNDILLALNESENNSDYDIFINYISKIKGLGAGQNKMRIKIPLILRELRCQNIYNNIPGELCCVPDERVKMSSKEIGIAIPTITSISSLFKASKVIYDNFGDLYDIPLFAYEDLKEDIM